MKKQAWYEWAHRWNQCNVSEIDPRDCDLEIWRRYWRENKIQGTILNAAGTVAFYQSGNPYQYRAKYLGNRDFLGDFCKLAREEGVAIVARMDASQAAPSLFEVHPDWFCRDVNGKEIPIGENLQTCINGGYYTQQLPGVIREVIEKYQPDAMADNSWAGFGGFICYCDNCKRLFKEYSGLELPQEIDYEDKTFRIWLDWSRKTRTKLYAYFNQISTEAGGEDCIYMGMLHPDAYAQNPMHLLVDYTEFGQFGKAVMVDGQIRAANSSLDSNTVQALSLHEIFGNDALILESVATYHLMPHMMRKSANTKEETQSWMRSAMLGGVSPSMHFIGGIQEDTRVFHNGEDVFKWAIENDAFLYHRAPVANVALIRSLRNSYYYGKNNCAKVTVKPMEGMIAGLKKGRISYFPIDIRELKQNASRAKAIVLPDIAVMQDEELDAVIDYIKAGGSIVYSGATGMLDGLGYPRDTFRLDELLGIKRSEKKPLPPEATTTTSIANLDVYGSHTYIRKMDESHEIFRGLEATAIIEMRGQCYNVRSDRLKAVANMVPAFPVYPPEFSYMDDGKKVSDQPAILAGDTGYGGRAVYFAADFDRRYADNFFPDHGTLLENAINWAIDDDRPFSVEGPGELDCRMFSQEKDNRYVLHIVNQSGINRYFGSIVEIYGCGRQKVTVRVGEKAIKRVELRNLKKDVPFTQTGCQLCFEIDHIDDQELVVMEY